jgi:hypothetical protein
VLLPTCVCSGNHCTVTTRKRRTGQTLTLAGYHSERQQTAWHSKRRTPACFVRADRHCFCSHHPGWPLCHRLICLGAALLPLTHLHSVPRVTEKTRPYRFLPFLSESKTKRRETLRSVSGTRCPGLIMFIESTPSCITQPKGVDVHEHRSQRGLKLCLWLWLAPLRLAWECSRGGVIDKVKVFFV